MRTYCNTAVICHVLSSSCSFFNIISSSSRWRSTLSFNCHLLSLSYRNIINKSQHQLVPYAKHKFQNYIKL